MIDLYRICLKCGETKGVEKFTYRRRIHKDCNECANRDYKHCKSCKLTRHINNFYRNHTYHDLCNKCEIDIDKARNESMNLAFSVLDSISFSER